MARANITPITFVFLFSKFVQSVHTKSRPVNINFHAKSGLCSSRNEQVMLNFVIWRVFCFSKFCQEMSVSYAQFCDMSAILFFKILSKFVQTVHTNFHAKSGVCSSKNEWVMALGTKEDGQSDIWEILPKSVPWIRLDLHHVKSVF